MTIHTVHFHIGVNNVYENLFAKVFCEPILELLDESFHVLSKEEYWEFFRKGIDSGMPIDFTDFLHSSRVFSQSLVISRPKILLSGKPLNQEGRLMKSLYKIDHAQEAFGAAKIVFHVFVTDHISYLMSKKEPGAKSLNESAVSWAPMVDGIYERIHSQNELWVWGAESAEGTARNLILNLMDAELSEAKHCVNEFIDLRDRKDSDMVEVDQDNVEETKLLAIDLAFENDASYFETRPYRYISCL